MVMPHKEWQALGSAAPKGAVVDDNLGFTKDRTISRLLEMQVHSEIFDILPSLRSAVASPELHRPPFSLTPCHFLHNI